MYKVCIWNGASRVVFAKLETFYWYLHFRTESSCDYSRATCSGLLGRHLVQKVWEHSIRFILKANLSRWGNAVGYSDSRGRGPLSPFIGRGNSTGQYGEPPLNSGVTVCGCHTARNILTTGGCSHLLRNSRRSIKLDGKAEPKGTKRVKPVRYTAAKLHDKGVLLGIDDLQTNQ